MRCTRPALVIAACLAVAACGSEPTATTAGPDPAFSAGGEPATPNFNLEVILRPADAAGAGFGHVTFRQAADEPFVIHLDTWIRDLAPMASYRLQRAVDTVPDDDCNDSLSSWLTLGLGLTPQDILTDDRGVGRAGLWRNVSAIPAGSEFDIMFRVIDASDNVVLQSECYQYVIRG